MKLCCGTVITVLTKPVDLTGPTDLGRVTRARRLGKSGQGKRIRQAADASLSDIAREVGVHPATVYRWEEGITRPGAEHAALWETVLAQLVEELAR